VKSSADEFILVRRAAAVCLCREIEERWTIGAVLPQVPKDKVHTGPSFFWIGPLPYREQISGPVQRVGGPNRTTCIMTAHPIASKQLLAMHTT
jgi:hypothetical protein